MEFEFALLMEDFRTPTVQVRGGFGLAQHGADVNGFAQIATVIFAKTLHMWNFVQIQPNAKKFCAINARWFPGLGNVALKIPRQ